jgi:hypothetical protein
VRFDIPRDPESTTRAEQNIFGVVTAEYDVQSWYEDGEWDRRINPKRDLCFPDGIGPIPAKEAR